MHCHFWGQRPQRGIKLADKVATLIANALRRAAVESAGLPMFSQRTQAGLFPLSALGKQAADRACGNGLFQRINENRDKWTLTEIGRERLLEEANPKQVLEDCVRAIEARHDQVIALKATLDSITGQLTGLQTTIESVLPTISPVDSIDRAVMETLNGWQSEAAEDCPLPELYRRTELSRPGLTIGSFHDSLRRLLQTEMIYLHPWTGPLYAVAEPAFAMLTGHEVAYYASKRNQRSAFTRPQVELAEMA